MEKKAKILALVLVIGAMVSLGLGLWMVSQRPEGGGEGTGDGEGGDQGTQCDTRPLNFTLLADTNLTNTSSTWGEVVYDGSDIVASYEVDGVLAMKKFDLDLNPIGNETRIVSSSEIGNDTVADHKHVFLSGYHYLVFSIASTGSGGDLYLVKVDMNLTRVGFKKIVNSEPPTNDMFLVTDGSYLYVGKFNPTATSSHKVLKYDLSLNWVANFTEGGGSNAHSNGAAVLYRNGTFNLVAPQGLAPGGNFDIYLLQYDTNWSIITGKRLIFHDPRGISLVTGLSFYNDKYIVDFLLGNGTYSIARAVFDCNWSLISNYTVYSGSYHAPHTIVVDNYLYEGYTNSTAGYMARAAKFNITILED
ncbi:MAG: hypothetical protein ACTSU2_02210 [Promethearchaeota archaeon]